MNQAHSISYDTREGEVMPATARRKMAFCSRVATPERAGDTKLRPSLVAFHEAKSVNVPTAQLIASAKELLVKVGHPNLILVASREAAVAVLFGVIQGK